MKNVLKIAWFATVFVLGIYASSECEKELAACAVFCSIVTAGILFYYLTTTDM